MTVADRMGRATERPATPAEERQVLTVSGKKVEVLIVGDGAPLVFLHGWGLHPRPYLPALRALAARGYRVYAPALPGFGGSAPLAPWRQGLRGIAEHITAALDALDLGGPVPIVGHSFGSGIALRIASRRPDLVTRLVLFSPVGGGGATDAIIRIPDMIASTFAEMTPSLALGSLRWFLPTLLRRPLPVAIAGHAAHHANLILETRAAVGAGVPVHFLFADADHVVRPGGLPTCAPSILSDTVSGGHSWLLTDPDRFAALAV